MYRTRHRYTQDDLIERLQLFPLASLPCMAQTKPKRGQNLFPILSTSDPSSTMPCWPFSLFSGPHLRTWHAVVAIPNLRISFCNSYDFCCHDIPEAHHFPATISSSPLIAVARLKVSKTPCHVLDCLECAIFPVKCGAMNSTKALCTDHFRFLRFSHVVH